jgi:hypothetical protein
MSPQAAIIISSLAGPPRGKIFPFEALDQSLERGTFVIMPRDMPR